MIRIIATLLTTIGLALLLAPTAGAAVNNFVITDYKIDYTLSRHTNNRSTLQTVETITARFPQTNQNHGIERAIPKDYDGHSVELNVTSVTDKAGKPLAYSTYTSAGNEVLRIGDADTYVHGFKTYVIHYTQHDVTKYFANTASDEFYWDTNGTDWRVPINSLTVRLTIDDSLMPALNGNVACYNGVAGSSDTCKLEKTDAGFTTTVQSLGRGENVTIAVGFKPNTFASYETPLIQKIFNVWLLVQIALAFVGLGLIIWLIIRYSRQTNRTNEHEPITVEFIPPKDTSVITSATIMPTYMRSSFTALLTDLAVRHYIKIYQTKEKSFLSLAEYELEIVKPIDSLLPDEKEILTDIFTTTSVGSRLEMKTLRNNTALYTRMSDNPIKLKKLIKGEYALRAKVDEQSAWYRRFAMWLIVPTVLLLSPVFILPILIAFVMSYTLLPLTDKGLALVRYIMGLKIYISAVEAEQLRMFQSPEGAEKTGVKGTDGKEFIKLYERNLPYAIMFGQEKEWNKRLGRYYEANGMQPDWYSSSNGAAFNAVVFSSAMSSFATTTSYSSASSSSSGGSSGGGSSGGGGGGGGGGGW